MNIRAKLALSINLLVMISMTFLGIGIVAVQRSYKRTDLERSALVIENSVRRVAMDTLLQKDDLQLVSYVNFLKGQYPALTYAKFVWHDGAKSHKVDLGELAAAPGVAEHSLTVIDPTAAQRRVDIALGIDASIIEQEIQLAQSRLIRIIAGIGGLTFLLGLALSYFLARTLTDPLKRLGSLAETIGRGHLGGRLEWRSQDEIGKLVEAFNAMSAKLEELEDAKKKFVSSVTHELRSPLGAITSFLHLVEAQLQGSSDLQAPRSLEYLKRVGVNIRRLEMFISDILDTAKIEKGRFECVLKPARIQDVAQDACQLFGARLQEQGVELKLNVAPDTPLILGDPERLRQVLVNLISNSLKFTPKGGVISISAEQYREGAQRWIELTVSDTGSGMGPEDLKRMFQLFSQGRNAAGGTIGPKGTGLGLYIAKSIIDQHEGKIQVKSAPGRGTSVSFSVKLAATEGGERPAEEAGRARS